MKDGNYTAILDVGKFLYYEKVNYCCKCMKRYRSVFDYVCLLPVMCIKCYSVHDNEPDGRSAKCSLCDVVFYREDCLRNHFNHMLTVCNKREDQKSCQFLKYCSECYSAVKQREWINNHWHCHNCFRVYFDYCKGFKQDPQLILFHHCHCVKESFLILKHVLMCIIVS